MTRLLNRLLACALLAASFAAQAQTDRATAESLMRKSGLWGQLGELGAQVAPAIRSGAAKGTPSDPALVEQVARAGSEAFAPDRLRASALQPIQQGLQADKLPALKRWYDSAAGRKVTQLEEAAAKNSAASQKAYIEEGVTIYEKQKESRKKLLDDLVFATNAPNAMVNATFALALAVTEGVGRAKPQQIGPSAADVKAMLDAQRPQLLQAFRSMSTASFAKTYATLNDAELKRYVDFLKTPAGQHFYTLTLSGLNAALADAGREFGARLPVPPPAAPASAPAAAPASEPATPPAPPASLPPPVEAPPARS